MNESGSLLFNLITDPVFQTSREGEISDLTLPQVLELMSGEAAGIEFTHLRAHQQHAWFAFLVQLAAMALVEADEDSTAQDAVRWAELLRRLTTGDDAPWCLVAGDPGKSAFMQPPVPEGRIDRSKWKRIQSPGMLDVLLTAKNHDVKAELVHSASPDHWCYALISLQTMEGFLGAGNYGIVRMNGGFASRPCAAFTTATDWGSRFVNDVHTLLEKRGRLIGDPWPYSKRGGHQLLWLLPWDGETALDLSRCDPYFIEVCRRVRLEMEPDGIKAFGLSTKAARISGAALNGITGDLWTPVDKEGNKTLTITSSGFDYELLHRLICTGDYSYPLGRNGGDSRKGKDTYFIASALSRGQGKTEGYHHRELGLPEEIASLLNSAEGRGRLEKLSKRRIVKSRQIRKVLSRALCIVTQGAPEGKPNFSDNRIDSWRSALNRSIDSIFFERLFSQIDLEDEAADRGWSSELVQLAESQLDDALRTVPQPSVRKYRVDSAARRVFHGMVRKEFPELFEDEDDTMKMLEAGGSHE